MATTTRRPGHREVVLGLIHSDGCRVVANDRGVASVRYHFSNRSEDIIGLLTAALDRLEIPRTSSSGPRPSRYRGAMSTTRRRRPALVALVFVAAAGCLALAWWQWTRYESTSGSFQNLGYALQWPMFAAFCFYGYYKFVRYEEAPPVSATKGEPTEIPDGLLPERPRAKTVDDDPTLREYNAYLAELAKSDTTPETTDDRTTP